MKRQVILIHGGTTFDTYKDYLSFLKKKKIDLDSYRRERWSSSLKVKLGTKFDVLLPKMPNPANAKYDEWAILFKKIAAVLKNNTILIGHSLGGIFLAKYLSENKFPKKILATFLIAPPYDSKNMDESLGKFNLPKSLKKLEKQGGRIFLYHSKDDKVVPFAHLGKYKKVLPGAVVRKFKRKGHFNQASFPELVRDIKSL
jgi:predicted alpha/beta hydrolase family esterase